ncbi:MAG: molybdenum cofactor biosynthesis protein MoaE [Pseudomonadota bacterium]|nr:molybdenum cofactor biosynthesis protein MoaE [Pseudomonadota bacterium]
MNIFFQKEKFIFHSELKKFSSKNEFSGSISSFLGKVRLNSDKNKVKFLEIEFYKKMAYFQTKKKLDNILKKVKIDDFLIIHRYGKLFPGENIILVLVASKHRKDGLTFTSKSVEWFKKEITFWKKENFKSHSLWVESEYK